VTPSSSAFSIDSISGVVSSTADLDRETATEYVLTIAATDLNSTHTVTTTLTVCLNDLNDNIPLFTAASFSDSASENSGIGAVVGSVSATDADIDANADLEFTIVSGNDDNIFVIDETGSISLLAAIDFESSVTSYSLVITVNNPGVAMGDTTTWDFSVVPYNDNAPRFSESAIVFSISENQAAGTAVGTVLATDRDVLIGGGSDSISFAFDMSNPYLDIDAAGNIVTKQVLFYDDTPNIYISVAATDDGTPSLTGHRLIHVRVLPENLNEPYFLYKLYSFVVTEDSAIGTIVNTITAVDPDVARGLPVTLKYSIVDDFGNEDQDLTVDLITGEIVVAKPLNRDVRSSYYFSLQVTDGIHFAFTEVTVAVDEPCPAEDIKHALNQILAGNVASLTPFSTVAVTTTQAPTTTTTPRMYPIVNSWTMSSATGVCNFPFTYLGQTHQGCVGDTNGLFVCEATPTLGGPAAIQYCDIEDGL
jgi:hypothetical protein